MKTTWICTIGFAAMTMMVAAPVMAQQQGSAAAGSGGTAATGGTSASSLGAGATTTGPNGDASALGMGASAAGPNATSRSGVHGNNNLNGQSMAMSHDQGTMSKSHTVCHDKSGASVDCKTMSMAHEPGEKPEKSTSEGSASIPQ
jgi:hypothetical protein